MVQQVEGQMNLSDLGIWSGRMYQEPCPQTKAKTSEQSSMRQSKSSKKMPIYLDLRRGGGHTPDASWEMGGALLGEYTMHSFGECPKEENVSRLSQILEENPHQKYSLSAKACQGILRRAEKRGKVLPPMLEQALRRQAGLSVSKNEPESREGKGILIQDEHTGALSTLNNQSVCAFEPGAASRVGGHVYEDDVAGTVRANAGDNQQAVVYGISAYESNAMKSGNPNSGVYEAMTARTLDLNGGSPACNQGGMAVVQGADMYNGSLTGDIAATLNASSGDSPTHSGPSVVCLEGNGSRPSHRGDGYSESETMYTLNSTEHHAVAVENHPADSRVKIAEDGKVQTLSGRMGTGGNNVPLVMESSAWDGGQVSPTLTANNANGAQRMPDKDNFNAVLSYDLDRAAYNQGQNAKFGFSVDEEKVGAQTAKGPGAVCNDYIVRRLTPLECERLQGYPDGWTDIGAWTDTKGKLHKESSDSARYKALGNSIALPFWFYLLRRIAAQYERPATLGSLFDGIGGFPLCWERCNGKGTARWASEIEEFPIAVTKKHFGEE